MSGRLLHGVAKRWTIIALITCALQGIVSAATLTATTSEEFTAALSSAALGDTILLTAGNSYTGTFILPNKTTGSGYITIQSSALASLPPAGTRIRASDAPNMPKIFSPGFEPAIKTAAAAHHFKLIGLELIGPANDSTLEGAVLSLGEGRSDQKTPASVPNNISIERCIVRANSAKQALQRGIGLQSASTDILDCRIQGCKYVGADSQAIAGWNGPGPFKILNNYIEGAGENVLFGGADPGIPDLVPSDITFQRNHCSKPLSWRVSDPSYAGTHWTVKNVFELKNARKVLVEGNIFENNWSDAQTGVAILFTPRNQEGTAPWCTVEDVMFINNIVRNTSSAYDVLGTDNEKPSQPAKRIKIQNNLMYNVDSKKWGSDGSEGVMYILLDSIDSLTIDHNTGFHTGNVITVDAGKTTGLVFTNNLHPHNAYGIIGSGNGPGNATLTQWFPKVVFQKNVLMGGPASEYSKYAGGWEPVKLGFPASWSGVLQDQGKPGDNFAGWKVVDGSAYDNAGTDGKDIGCDIDAVVTATAGCVSGVWGGK